MGSVVSRVTRFRGRTSTVNIKRPPAPKPAVQSEVNAPGDEALHQPNKEFLGRLKDVYVSSSTDTLEQENTYGSERKTSHLPQDRHALYEDPLDDPDSAPRGYLTIKDCTRILQHQQPGGNEVDKNIHWPPERIAQVYGISQEDAENLMRYFTGYKVVATIKKPIPDMTFHKLHE